MGIETKCSKGASLHFRFDLLIHLVFLVVLTHNPKLATSVALGNLLEMQFFHIEQTYRIRNATGGASNLCFNKTRYHLRTSDIERNEWIACPPDNYSSPNSFL